MSAIQIFIPCFMDQLYPQTAMNMVKILEKLGCEVHYNSKQTCCGQPAYNAGYFQEATQVSKKFIKDFKGNEPIVSPSGSCTGFIRHGFTRLMEGHTSKIESTQVQSRVYEFSEYLTQVLHVTDIGARFQGKATYHDACGALRECNIKEGPRTLLKHVRDLELVEMPECETCCGFGGTFAIKFETISIAMAQTKVKSALDSGAQFIISTDISCLMHMQGYIDHHELPIQTIHLADVLVSGW